jgi:hypothetical protein
MTVSLWLFEPLAQGTDFREDLTPLVTDWNRTTKAIGGYWQGGFSLSDEHLTACQLDNFYRTRLGCQVKEITYSRVTWEGEIVELELTLDGITYRRTLEEARWQNKVKIQYRAGSGSNTTSTAWSEITSSSDLYGESGYIDVVTDDYNSDSATARRDRILTDRAFPQVVSVRGFEFRGEQDRQQRDNLKVRCVGNVFGMNRRYYESNISSAAISTQISTLTAASEFVTAGKIDTNAMSVPVYCQGQPDRLWILIEDLICRGDTAGNSYVAGVYSGRKLDYNAASTSVTHYWRDGQLVNALGIPISASEIKPDIVVENSSSMIGLTPAGGAKLDSSYIFYVEEVEFQMPDKYKLIPGCCGA